jgi:hypothetical protein
MYICYDPNYNYEENDDEDGMDCDEDVDDESEDEYSDDDDMSWKVRRAAAKCLAAVIATRHELLDDLYATVSPALISRFKEREENVKADIFNAYVALLKQTKTAILPQMAAAQSETEMMDMGEDGPAGKLLGNHTTLKRNNHATLQRNNLATQQSRNLAAKLLTDLYITVGPKY